MWFVKFVHNFRKSMSLLMGVVVKTCLLLNYCRIWEIHLPINLSFFLFSFLFFFLFSFLSFYWSYLFVFLFLFSFYWSYLFVFLFLFLFVFYFRIVVSNYHCLTLNSVVWAMVYLIMLSFLYWFLLTVSSCFSSQKRKRKVSSYLLKYGELVNLDASVVS